jgi:hypothetical protein
MVKILIFPKNKIKIKIFHYNNFNLQKISILKFQKNLKNEKANNKWEKIQ